MSIFHSQILLYCSFKNFFLLFPFLKCDKFVPLSAFSLVSCTFPGIVCVSSIPRHINYFFSLLLAL